MSKKVKKILSLALCLIMTMSVFSLSSTAFAAVSAPSVTLSNASATSIKISWNKISSATKYVIYRSVGDSKHFKTLKTITGNTTISYTNGSLTAGTKYYYKVAASDGKTTKTSTYKSIVAKPPTVTGVKTTSPKCKQVKVTFNKSSGATGYEIYTSADNKTFAKKASTTNLYYTISVGVGKSVYVKVRAYKTVNNSRKYGNFSSVVKGTSKHSYVKTVVKPTCVASGYTLNKCSVCGYSYKNNTTKATGVHTWKLTKTVAAKCETTGKKYYSCVNCTKTKTTTIAATGHNFAVTGTIAPTCEDEGYTTRKCSKCSKVEQIDKVAPTGHTYTKKVVKPTCTAQGYTKYTCSVCGSYYKGDIVAATGHKKVADAAVAATCTKAGLTKGYHCSVCNKVLTSQQTVPATGHTEEVRGYVAPTDTKAGYTGDTYCSVCGIKLVTGKTISAKGHTYVVSKTVKPTCTEQGYSVYVCTTSGCGATYEGNYVAPKGHTAVTDSAVAATCTNTGKTKGSHCSVCDDVITAQTTVPALGHKQVVQNAKAPTCTDKGYTGDIICSVCNTKLSTGTDIPELSHDITKALTLSSYKVEGTVLKAKCSNCSDYVPTDTLVLDIAKLTATNDTISTVAKYNADSQKLTLVSDFVTNFELTGTKSKLTVSVDALYDGEIKLNNCSITNSPVVGTDGKTVGADDCIRINDKCTRTKTDSTTGAVEKVVPTISISAKDSTTNKLVVDKTGGNAIESTAKLELKGHGVLNVDTVGTGIDSKAKISIKNITLNITSKNRGIDTKDVLEDGVTEDYSNIDFYANAKVTVESTDDGVRCKNLEFKTIDTANGDVGSVLTLTSGADAFQLEGKTGLTMNSGKIVIKAGTPKIKKGLFVGQKVVNGTDIILIPKA